MKVVFVYDTDKGKEIAEAAISGINGVQTIFIDASKHPLAGCLGCFGCWLKTPGICIQKNNDSSEYLKNIYDSNYVVFVTKITFGSYSAKTKAYLDRIIPLSHPFFVKTNNEMHHQKRYDSTPGILAIGYDAPSAEVKELFIKSTNANMHNSDLTEKGVFNSFVVPANTDDPKLKTELSSWMSSWLSSITETL